MHASTAAHGTWRDAWRSALLAFALSRVLVFAGALMPALLLPEARHGVASDRVLMRFDAVAAGEQLQALALRNDAGWYRGIVEQGYERRPFEATRQANWAFFPLLPLLWRAAIGVFGDTLATALLLPNLCLLLALVALHRLGRVSGRDEATAARATLALALLPGSQFFSFPWSEAPFLLCSLLCFLAAAQRHWGAMALAGIAAGAARVAGVFLPPLLLLQCWRTRERDPRAWLACAAMPLGTLAFMGWLAHVSGHALAFAAIQSAWGRAFEPPLRAIGIVLLRPWELAIDWNLRPLNLAMLLLSLWAVRHLLRRGEPVFAGFLALGVLAGACSGTLTSLSRYAAALFPLALALADATATPRRAALWFAASAALLALLSLGFGYGINFASA